MTSPVPPSSPNPPSVTFSNGLLGGASGSLGGTNVLQGSIDALTQAVTSLTTTMAAANFSSTSSSSTAMAGNRQQQNNGGGFPQVNNPFQMSRQQPGIGGGGSGGAGNVSSPSPFGSGMAVAASALVSFGTSQMQPQLTLNSYATQAAMLSGGQMKAMYGAVGATPGSISNLGTGIADNVQLAMTLSQLTGLAPNKMMGSALGRAGMGATAAFGMTNPTLSAGSAGNLAAGLYAPTFSQNMMALGYNPIRSMTGGAPMNAGQSAQSIMQGLYGKKTISQSSLYGNLSSPRGQAVLSALDNGSGITNAQMQSYLSGYNQLFQKGLTVKQANSLFTTAAGGQGISQSSARAAQNRLSSLGVSPAASDIQMLKNNQATQTGRLGDYAGGFNAGISDATGLLEKFNTALNSLMSGPLGAATGYGGAMGGVMAGAGGGVGLAGSLGIINMMRGLAGKGAASAATSAAGGAAGSAATGGLAGAASAAATTVGIGLISAGTVIALNKLGGKLAPAGSAASRNASVQTSMQKAAGNPTGDMLPGIPGINGIAGWAMSLFGQGGTQAAKGGGAIGISGTQQGMTGGSNMNSGVSGSAKKAVGAAESQIGVPYQYGAEAPGVGFDCSALVQWAYKQAGVSLPRTSEAQWDALKRRSVPAGSAREGDLVFMAGSDGTAAAPGHVGMMINDRQLIQAPHSGADVQVIAYDPKAWSHAARPSGSGSFITGSSGINSGNSSSPGLSGNRGASMGSGGSYGSVNEADVISAMGGALGGSGGLTGAANGTSGSKNTVTSGGSSGGSSMVPASASRIEAIARQILQPYGWSTGTQWQDFVKTENREAGWQMTAKNPGSGAYGLAQFIDGPSEYYKYGGNPDTAQGQLKGMANYIKGRYGSPSGAWAHEQNSGWYGAGGQVSVVGERGPELMMSTPGGGTQVFSNSQTMAFINSIKGNTAQSPWKTDITSGTGSSPSSSSVSINFNKGSIVISGTGSSSDVSKSGREVVSAILKHLDSEAVHEAISRGRKL